MKFDLKCEYWSGTLSSSFLVLVVLNCVSWYWNCFILVKELILVCTWIACSILTKRQYLLTLCSKKCPIYRRVGRRPVYLCKLTLRFRNFMMKVDPPLVNAMQRWVFCPSICYFMHSLFLTSPSPSSIFAWIKFNTAYFENENGWNLNCHIVIPCDYVCSYI